MKLCLVERCGRSTADVNSGKRQPKVMYYVYRFAYVRAKLFKVIVYERKQLRGGIGNEGAIVAARRAERNGNVQTVVVWSAVIYYILLQIKNITAKLYFFVCYEILIFENVFLSIFAFL